MPVKNELVIYAGALSPRLALQLKKQGLRIARKEDIERYQRALDNSAFLRIHRLVTKKESNAIERRIFNAICKLVVPL